MLLPIFNPSLGRREKLPQKVGRKEKLAEKVGRREIYPPVPPPSNRVKLFFCKERFDENSLKVYLLVANQIKERPLVHRLVRLK